MTKRYINLQNFDDVARPKLERLVTAFNPNCSITDEKIPLNSAIEALKRSYCQDGQGSTQEEAWNIFNQVIKHVIMNGVVPPGKIAYHIWDYIDGSSQQESLDTILQGVA